MISILKASAILALSCFFLASCAKQAHVVKLEMDLDALTEKHEKLLKDFNTVSSTQKDMGKSVEKLDEEKFDKEAANAERDASM